MLIHLKNKNMLVSNSVTVIKYLEKKINAFNVYNMSKKTEKY